MNDIDEQIEQTPIADPSTTDEIRNKGGRPKGSSKPKIDWYARREEIWDKMNAAIDSGAPAPAVIRALQSQLDTCNQQIAQDHDDKQERQVKALQDRIKELNPQPPVPVPTAQDVESERRVNKMLAQLEEQRQRREQTPVLDPAVTPAVVDPQYEKRAREDAEKKLQAEAEKKSAEDKKTARIAELKQMREDIYRSRSNPGVMLAAATNPTFLRDGNQALKEIDAELRQLENPQPRKSPEFDPEAYDRQRAAREERELTARMLEGERITAANRANARPAPISGGLGYCEGPEWNR